MEDLIDWARAHGATFEALPSADQPRKLFAAKDSSPGGGLPAHALAWSWMDSTGFAGCEYVEPEYKQVCQPHTSHCQRLFLMFGLLLLLPLLLLLSACQM